MHKATLHIKNMVCPRCIQAVEGTLKQMGLNVHKITLGRVDVTQPEEELDYDQINRILNHLGFELLQGQEQQLAEQIKIALIHYLDMLEKHDRVLKTSTYLSEAMGMSYSRLSKLFSRHENVTIEKYLILLKIERVKEWLSYDEMTLSEIAHRLKYSSVNHLSNQFKNITGITVSEFKNQPYIHRHSFDLLS